MDNNYILSVIWEYAGEWMTEPQKYMPRTYFNKCSYERWAVNEVMRCIKRSPEISPVEAVENLIGNTRKVVYRKGKIDPIFSVLYDVAIDILGLLMAMEEEEHS